MMVKKTWRKRLTALMSTAKRYNHASPDILTDLIAEPIEKVVLCPRDSATKQRLRAGTARLG